MPQTLKVFQSRWGMELRRPDKVERTDEEVFEMVAAAGFDGMSLDFSVDGIDTARKRVPMLEGHGLARMINAFPRTVAEMDTLLRFAKDEAGADVVVVIGEVMPFTVDEGVTVIRAWMDMAEHIGIPMQIETHRNCITNDLFYTLQLMQRIPDMPICADLSHYLVDREFWWPIGNEDQELIHRILRRADGFQGRVASREQIQVQLGFPQHQDWVNLFRQWWEDGFRYWRKRRAGEDATLYFLCELGPPEYAMTGPDGYEMSDRWAEAQTIRQWVLDSWATLDAEAGG